MLDEGTTNDIINGNLKIFKGAIFENIVADAFIKNENNLYYFYFIFLEYLLLLNRFHI